MAVSFFQSLRFRLIASVVVVEVIMLSIMVWNNVEFIYRSHTERLNDTARSTIQQFSSAAGSYMAEIDYAGLQELAQNLIQQNELSYLVVLDAYDSPVIQIGRKYHDIPKQQDKDPTHSTNDTFDIASDISIAELPLGKVFMGFSLQYMLDSIRTARNRSMMIAAIEIALSTLVTIMLGFRLTRNLSSLAQAARRVGAGHFDTSLDIKRKDEVGMTAHAFNMMVQDIAERTQRIHESESSIRLLMDSTSEGIVGVSRDSLCMFINRAGVEMLGYESPDQFVGKDFHMIAHHHHPDGTVYPADECIIRIGAHKNELFYTEDEQYIRADGSFFPVEVRTHPIMQNGERDGLVMIFSDITERKKDQSRIRQLNKELSLLLESTGEGIFGVDRDLRCTFINRAASRLLGYSVGDLLQKDMYEIAHYADENRIPTERKDSLLYRCIHENRAFISDEEILWTRDGTAFPAHYSVSPITEGDILGGAVVVFRNVSEAREMANQMDYLATHDSLTDLFNRREFELRLQHLIDEISVEKSEHILCYMDLDQFKVVNDTCGHVAGDELLRQLTGILSRKIRKHDTLARLGGDEFGLILAHCNINSALNIIEDIRHTVNDFRFVWEENIFSVGISVGITIIDQTTENLGKVLSEADAACYIAKDTGRNRIHIYEKDNADVANRIGEMRWVSVINTALDEDAFTLYYQPIMPVNSPGENDTLVNTHFEILLRLKSDKDEFLPPGAFIPAAERYGLMEKIDAWVVENTFRWLAANPEQMELINICSINLSAPSLNGDVFLNKLQEQIRTWNIPGDKICFEITETAAISNLNQALHFIKTLKRYGCKFALDDFGSGMSSFAYLKNLPVDFLKIDGYFVRDIVDDSIDSAMVDAVNKVGQVMGISTIAEFVESDAILSKLRTIGVDYAQGYYIARPAPLEMLSIEK